jgi:hypothetical protein
VEAIELRLSPGLSARRAFPGARFPRFTSAFTTASHSGEILHTEIPYVAYEKTVRYTPIAKTGCDQVVVTGAVRSGGDQHHDRENDRAADPCAASANTATIVSMVNAIELVVWIGVVCVAIRPTARWPPSSATLPVIHSREPAPIASAPVLASSRSRPSRFRRKTAAVARHKNPAIAIEM